MVEQIPRSCTEIDARWLNSVLSDETRGGADVRDVTVDLIGEGVGFMGEVARLTLGYGESGSTGVQSLIAKVPTLVEGARFIGQLLGVYEKEHSFYRDIAPEIRIRIPAAHVNLANAETGDYILLLEDLSPMRPGDQLASCTADEAEAALDSLAKLHARWWNHPRLSDFSTWLPAAGDPFFDLTKGATADARDPFLELWGDAVPPAIVDLIRADALDDSAYDARLEATIGRAPYTFVHGDFRLDNMMFGDGVATAPVAIIDWQLPFRANPMLDVVYFLAGNFSPDARRATEDQLLRSYHAALLEGGVTDYAFDQCWDDYRANAVVLLSYAITAAGNIDLDETNDRGKALFEAMFERYMAAIIDLDSISLLP